MSLPERLGNLSMVNDQQPPKVSTDPGAEGQPIQRCVIIQRDEKGYGFTISGDNPVFVQSVKPDGAAAKAGVQQGDKIIKVNGNLVTSFNHTEVVNLIKSGSYVVLMLLGKAQNKSSDLRDVAAVASERVTAPQPVDHEKDQELRKTTIKTIEMMLQQATEDFEKAKKTFLKNQSEKQQAQMNEKEKTVRTLERQLQQLRGMVDLQPDSGSMDQRFVDWHPGGAKHSKHGSVPVSLYKTRQVVDVRDINVSRSKSDAATKQCHLGSPDSYPHLQEHLFRRSDTAKETASLPSTSDVSSMSDSPQTSSPNTSPTPMHPYNARQMCLETDVRSDSEVGISEETIGSTTEPCQLDIICPEDEEFVSDEEINDDHKPFLNLDMMEFKPAYLSIFLHYLISNSDPSVLFFYIISDIYKHAPGGIKELRKWAYEIYSTFLLSRSPLRIGIDDVTLATIDSVLTNKCDKEDSLRGLFSIARNSAKGAVKELLQDFWSKKQLGLGNIYGVHELKDHMEKNVECRIIEKYLLPHLDRFVEVKVKSDRDQAMGWALATFLRHVGVTKSTHCSLVERVQSFVMKERKEKGIKLPGSKSKAKSHRGHQFVPQHYYTVTVCMNCQGIIWGVGLQGYHCSSCDNNVHKQCIELTEEICSKRQKRTSTLMDKFGRKPSNVNPSTVPQPSVNPIHVGGSVFHSQSKEEEEVENTESAKDSHSVNKLVQRYEKKSPLGPNVEIEDVQRKMSTVLGRSESLKGRVDQKGDRPARRAKSDVDMDENAIKSLNNSGCSLASSLSSSRSLESIGHPDSDNDSDLDVETEMPTLSQVFPEEILRKMKPKEKKRQEVINELFYTEQAHMRNLKILDMLFYRPMKRDSSISQDLVKALFPNLDEMIQLHKSMNIEMKARRKENPVVSGVGDILLRRFDGEAGESFTKGCAIFCRDQSAVLEALRLKQKKDQRLANFLAEAELSPMCRRLQLKDLIPAQMQRLTKYRLLIENLLKYTQTNTEEFNNLEKVHQRCKRLLEYVNQAVKECENYARLTDLQRRIDKKPLETYNNPNLEEFKNLDVTKHKLIYDGPLTWQINPSKNKTVDLHVILLEDLLILLQKQDDRLVLKCHDTTLMSRYTHTPVLRVGSLLARNIATNKKGFFLVSTLNSGPQIYQLTAPTVDEQKKWSKYITAATEAFKNQGSNLVNQKPVAQPPPPQPSEPEEVSDSEEPLQNNPQSEKDEPQEDMVSEDTIDGMETFTDANVQMSENTPFVQPEEVVVSGTVSTQSEPAVLSSLEALRENNQIIKKVMMDREKIIAEILHIPFEDYHHIAEMAADIGGEKDTQEMMLACFHEVNQLILLINSSQELVSARVHANDNAAPKEGKPPVLVPIPMEKLQEMTTRLNSMLANVMSVINTKDEEQDRLRRELKLAKDQMNKLREMQRQVASSGGHVSSRPLSVVSNASSASEQYEETVAEQAEVIDSEGRKMLPAVGDLWRPTTTMHSENVTQLKAAKEIESDSDPYEEVTDVVDHQTGTPVTQANNSMETILSMAAFSGAADRTEQVTASQNNFQKDSSTCSSNKDSFPVISSSSEGENTGESGSDDTVVSTSVLAVEARCLTDLDDPDLQPVEI